MSDLDLILSASPGETYTARGAFDRVRSVSCPKCLADIGNRCIYTTGPWDGSVTTTVHNERLRLLRLVENDLGKQLPRRH